MFCMKMKVRTRDKRQKVSVWIRTSVEVKECQKVLRMHRKEKEECNYRMKDRNGDTTQG
jgi:hypothetical protein